MVKKEDGVNVIEPSDAERAAWTDATRGYVEALEFRLATAEAAANRDADAPVELRELVMKDGRLDLTASHPLLLMITNELASFFKSAGGVNFVCVTLWHKTLGTLSLILQRAEGKTPEQVMKELRAELAAVKAERDAMRSTLDRIAAAVDDRFDPRSDECIADGVDSLVDELASLKARVPRIMQANKAVPSGHHGIVHVEAETCARHPACVPVDVPEIKPDPSRYPCVGCARGKDACSKCMSVKQEKP